jgi:glycosyltransferase involved in cell wall biosynthesis
MPPVAWPLGDIWEIAMKINISGPLNLCAANRSWGLALTNFALELIDAGHEVFCLSVNGQHSIDQRIRPYMVSEINPSYPTLTYCNPPDLARIKAKNIYAMFGFESSVLPQGWAAMLNDKRVRVIVNSTQQRDLFLANGVHSKIVPLGYDPEIFNPEVSPLDLGNDKYKFLSIGIPHFRKGHDLLLKAFAEEFKPREKVCLVIKTDRLKKCNYWEINIVKEIKKVQQKRTAEIMLIHGQCETLASLYRACQCYVSPTRAEGFGLTVLEAMACGLPVIASPVGAIPEICINKRKGTVIPGNMVEALPKAQYHTYQRPARIFEPSVYDLGCLMRFIMEQKHAPHDMTGWTWAAATQKLLAVMGAGDEFETWVKKPNREKP